MEGRAARAAYPQGWASQQHVGTHSGDTQVVGKVFVLALAAAVYPTLLAIVVLILTRPHPTRLFAGFLIGGMAMSMTIGAVILAFADTSKIDTNSSSSPRPWVNIFLGLVLLFIWRRLATGRDLPGAERRRLRSEKKAREKAAAEAAGEVEKESAATRLIAKDSPVLAIFIGAALSLPSLWYLAALKDIDQGDYSTPAAIGMLVLFNLIMFALIEIPLIFFLVRPGEAAAMVARFDAWLRGHTHEIAMWVCGIAGVGLIIEGLRGLL